MIHKTHRATKLTQGNVTYALQTNPRLSSFRTPAWEATVREWHLLTIASHNWRSGPHEICTDIIKQYDRVLAIGVGHGDAFRDTHTSITGVDITQDIHTVCSVNCRMRGTPYTSANMTAVFVDCEQDPNSIVNYVRDYHSGPILAVNKTLSKLQSIQTAWAGELLNNLQQPRRTDHASYLDYKAHSILYIPGS